MSAIVAESVPHPCVRNCCLDDADICMGCFRSLEEILAWHEASESGKREILHRCAERKKRQQSPRRG